MGWREGEEEEGGADSLVSRLEGGSGVKQPMQAVILDGVVTAEGVKNAIKTCLHEALCCLGNPFTYIINFELTKSLFKKQNSHRKAAEQ